MLEATAREVVTKLMERFPSRLRVHFGMNHRTKLMSNWTLNFCSDEILEQFIEETARHGIIVVALRLSGHFELTDAGIERLGVLTDLKTLEILGERLAGTGFAALGGLLRLKLLLVDSPKLNDEGLGAIATLTGLTDLSIVRSEFLTAAGLSHLAALVNLESLTFLVTNVDGEGLPPLPSLKRLHLEPPHFTAAALQHLANQPQLAELSLTGGKDSGLALALPGLVHLHRLVLILSYGRRLREIATLLLGGLHELNFSD